ncbi:MAG: hypothetical protein ACK4YO_02390 [Candidatus Altarchaeaceae archaeon]
MKKFLFFAIIVGILIGIIGYANAECPKLYNYVEKIYKTTDEKESNILEFDIESDEQLIPVYIYIDSTKIQEQVVLNLSERKNGRFFDHVKIDLKDRSISEYFRAPGIHTLLITTDPDYTFEDISGLCENPLCNKAKHKCAPSDRIIKKVKVVSTKRRYGADFKLYTLNNTEISYIESEFDPLKVFENVDTEGEYKWKFFILGNQSIPKYINETKIKTEKFSTAIVVEGIIYDNNAKPAEGIIVVVYIVGPEKKIVHIATVTDREGKFVIYYRPEFNEVYRIPKIGIYSDGYFDAYLYGGLKASKVDLTKKMGTLPEKEYKGLPVVETFIIGLIIGTILTLFGVGYLQKIFKRGESKEHEH